MYQIRGNFHISTNILVISSVGRHIIIAIGQVVVESQLRVSQCPMAVDRGIGCNAY